MTHEQIEQVAQRAAEMYGQAWKGLPNWSKDIWRETVRHADPADIQTDVQRCAAAAKKLWREDQEGQKQEAQPVEKKSRNKK